MFSGNMPDGRLYSLRSSGKFLVGLPVLTKQDYIDEIIKSDIASQFTTK